MLSYLLSVKKICVYEKHRGQPAGTMQFTTLQENFGAKCFRYTIIRNLNNS